MAISFDQNVHLMVISFDQNSYLMANSFGQNSHNQEGEAYEIPTASGNTLMGVLLYSLINL